MITSVDDVQALVSRSVRDFRTKFNCSNDPVLAERLVREEVAEVREAAAHLLKELIDLTYVVENAHQAFVAPLYSCLSQGLCNECWNLTSFLDAFPDDVMEEAFKRVHASNMMKIGNDTGDKIQKGPNYVEPDLSDLI